MSGEIRRLSFTSEMGSRVEKAFGPKMEHLMRMQLAFDLAQARESEIEVRVKRYIVENSATEAKTRTQRMERFRLQVGKIGGVSWKIAR